MNARLARTLRPLLLFSALLISALPAAGPARSAAAPTLTPLHVFSPTSNNVNAGGAFPQAALLALADGFLYGTASAGGAGGTGVVFRILPDGTGAQVLHEFGATDPNTRVNADGANPFAGLLAPGDGYLYGTARGGGAHAEGVVFRLHADGTGFADLHDFAASGTGGVNSDGAFPFAGLLAPGDGFLYGTAEGGGAHAEGVVFRLHADGTGFQTLHDFAAVSGSTNAGGALPFAGLLAPGDGFLYGTAEGGGANGAGTVFRLHADGTGFQTLHDFSAPGAGGTGVNAGGAFPQAGLLAPGDGLLYGTASSGGANGAGVVFRLHADGTGFQTLHDFAAVASGTGVNADGTNPYGGLITPGDGFLYGTAYDGGAAGSGTVFRLKTDGTGFQTLHDFSAQASNANADGAFLRAGLVVRTDGLLYGAAGFGGASGSGTVFRLKTDGTGFQTLHDFSATRSNFNPDGAYPEAALISAGDGFLYGAAYDGGIHGTGDVFRVRPDGTGFADLHDFADRPSFTRANADGANPAAGLVAGGDGFLYGTASSGGANGAGTVFRLHADGTGFADLHDFAAVAGTSNANAGGASSNAALLAPGDGFLYGTAPGGGANGAGTVFRLKTDGTGFQTLHDFAGLSNRVNAEGAFPYAGLVAGGDGLLYGTAEGGGANGTGAVFRLAPDGTGFADLHDFAASTGFSGPNADGTNPYGGLIAPGDGYVYGAASGGGATGNGTVFRLKTDGTGFQTLHDFSAPASNANADGGDPLAGLVAGGDGFLYGTTYDYGPNGDDGTVFRLHPDGTGFQTYYAFNETDPRAPFAPLFAPGDGFLYGTTNYGGPGDAGSVFRLTGPPVTHVLWDSPGGKVIFWDVNADATHTVAGTYGPFADDASGGTGWAALSLSTGPDGASHLLWSNPDGRTCLWTLQADGSHADFFYGLMEDDGTPNTIWRPVAVSTGGDNVTHVLWTNPDGRTILWDVDAQGGFTIVGNYDPQPGYTPAALATGPDGLSHILWNGADGTTLLWNLDAADSPTPATYPLMEDDGTDRTVWQARALSVGPDGTVHVLWDDPDGRAILWDVAGDGSFTIAGNYGPFQDDASGNTGYTAVSLATGADGLSHFLWDNPDGNTYLWSVQGNGGFTPTFYPPFYDGAGVWKGVAVSAAL